MKRTYLVTGGAGFIGSNYIHYMFEKYGDSIQIINVDKLTYAGRLENLAEVEDRGNYRFIEADICDKEMIESLFSKYVIDRVVHFAAESHVDRSLAEVEDRGNYRFIEADICDKEMIESLFSKYVIDRVVHFAAESHVDRSIDDPEIFVKTNVLGTAVLLNAARKAWEKEDGMYLENKKFLHVSTDEVYGSLGETGYFYETTPYAPHSPYSASKASADMLVRSYMDTYGFPANITNCSNNYGPRQFPEKLIPLIIKNALQGEKLPIYGDGLNVRDWLYVEDHVKANNYGPRQFPEKLIPLIIKNALQGEKLPIYGDGLNVRDWLYVEDHVKAIDLVQEQGRLFETYNIGGHNEKTNLEIVNTILEVLRKALEESDPRKAFINDGLIEYVEDRKGHDRRYAINADKIRRETGWMPETSFEEGIRKTVRWYVDKLDCSSRGFGV